MDDTPNRAVEAVVIALGGSKVVAPMLWPEKGIIEAQRLLCDCLNDDRPAKLDFAQVLYIFRLAQARGIHTGMQYIARNLGYAPPVPIDPKDELADLLRQSIEANREVQRRQERIERLLTETQARPALRAAA